MGERCLFGVTCYQTTVFRHVARSVQLCPNVVTMNRSTERMDETMNATSTLGTKKSNFWMVARQAVEAGRKPAKVANLALVAMTSDASNDTMAIPATVRTCARIRLTDLRHKDWTLHGYKYEGRVLKGHHADIEPKKSIRLYGHESNHVKPHDYDITFKIGDSAIYGSYNLVYTGEIIAIGEKTVKIREDKGTKVHSLDIATFSDRNRGYDAEKIFKRNSEWMD